MPAVCRDCSETVDAGRLSCTLCGSRRLLGHDELLSLSIAHIDCDAFYAAVEKRDDPALRSKPVIVGGGRRGVVSACCYVARIKGVRSAMPMFKALKVCPEAVVIRPDMEKYAAAGRQVRELMQSLTPLVEPLSIDEAFLDLTGTEALHGAPPARILTRLVRRIEDEVRITASVGLSYNKFLAKIASDLDKPRGFSVIGKGDAAGFLAEKPVGIIWGVGKSLRSRLENDGIRLIADLRTFDEAYLVKRYGAIGGRLARFAWGRDDRKVAPGGDAKSVSAETTFETDIHDPETLTRVLWRLSEKVSKRLKAREIAGCAIVLKLKTADFRTLTRSSTLLTATQLADDIFRAAEPMLVTETGPARRFRLLGVGVQKLTPAGGVSSMGDLADPDRARRVEVEAVMDKIRGRFGDAAVEKGRGFKPGRT